MDVDESVQPGESALGYVARVARDKAQAGAVVFPSGVLAADTTVALGDEIFGKPADFDDFRRIWGRLGGARHAVHTAVAVRTPSFEEGIVVSTEVCLRSMTDDALRTYWDTGEPKDKAGGYAIQGIGAVWVDAVYGSFTNVIGLPLAETLALLERAGLLPADPGAL